MRHICAAHVCVCVLHVGSRQEQDMEDSCRLRPGRPKVPVQPVAPVLISGRTVLTFFLNLERGSSRCHQQNPRGPKRLSEDQLFLILNMK